MATSDDLRDKLTEALSPWEVFTDTDGQRSVRLVNRNEKPVIDALMPVVREALAGAWSTGFREGRNADHQSCWWPKNPWRGEQ